MIYLNLIKEFFITGLFAFGGGYSTVPFLAHISDVYQWYSQTDLTQMLAIAAITPGPVGINVATYAGVKTAGIWGALCATFAEVLPAIIMVNLIAGVCVKYKENIYFKSIIYVLKPVSCALLTIPVISMLKGNINNIFAAVILMCLLIYSFRFKKSPLFYFVISGMAGLIYTFCF